MVPAQLLSNLCEFFQVECFGLAKGCNRVGKTGWKNQSPLQAPDQNTFEDGTNMGDETARFDISLFDIKNAPITTHMCSSCLQQERIKIIEKQLLELHQFRNTRDDLLVLVESGVLNLKLRFSDLELRFSDLESTVLQLQSRISELESINQVEGNMAGSQLETRG